MENSIERINVLVDERQNVFENTLKLLNEINIKDIEIVSLNDLLGTPGSLNSFDEHGSLNDFLQPPGSLNSFDDYKLITLDDRRELILFEQKYIEYINEIETEFKKLDDYIDQQFKEDKNFFSKLTNPKILIASGTLLTGVSISILIMPVGLMLGAKVAIGSLGLATYAGYFYMKKR